MPDYNLLSSYDTVQVLSASTAAEAVYCTIQTHGSGSIVQRTVPKAEFNKDRGVGILDSLAHAVDNAISGGLASDAVGTQDIDGTGLVYDAVVFTVEYEPAYITVEPLTTTVTIPVNVLTADTAIGGAVAGGSAAERLQAAYLRLKALAGE